MNFIGKMFFGCAALLGLCIISCSENEQSDNSVANVTPVKAAREIVFGIYTADKASTTVAEFAPVIEWLETELKERTGEAVRIRMRVSNQYLEGIGDLAEGRAHFSRLGPASYILAVDENPGLEILAMESEEGDRNFKGVFAIHSDSELKSLQDLKGKSFAFGDPLSTIGRYLSQEQLLKAGIKGGDLAKYSFLGRHDTVGMAVAAGDYDAGALKISSYEKLVKAGQPLKKLADFDNITKPWVYHPDLDPAIALALREAMLEIKAEDAVKIGVDGFLEANPDFYLPIRDAMEISKNFDESSNDSISSAETKP